MKCSRFAALLAALLVLGPIAGCGDEDEEEEFTAELSGANEVPAVTTDATGSATFEAEGDAPTEITFDVEVSDITGVTAAHIHNGPAGQNGPVVAFLCGGQGTPACGTGADFASGTLTAASLQASGNIASIAELLTAMRAETIYANVHTMANPGGEIRGQLQFEGDD